MSDPNSEQPPLKTQKTSLFLTLPVELKLLILENLSAQDIVNVRLISLPWAAASAGLLFKNGFSVRPHHDDMSRLENVSKYPEFAQGIHHLEFFVGDMDREQYSSAIIESFSGQPALRKGKSKLPKLPFHVFNTLDAIFTPERFSRHCDKSILERVFPLLQNLASITITSTQSPFSTSECPGFIWEWLQDAHDDHDKSHCFDPTISRNRYIAILLATLKLSTPIERLTLDSIPVDCFYLEKMDKEYRSGSVNTPRTMDLNFPKSNDTMKNALSHVKDLTIGFIGAGDFRLYDDLRLARTLGNFLGAFQHLRNLDLSWNMDDDETDEFIEAWEKSFYSNKFPFLESLRLQETETDDNILLPFLYRHASTLKRLQLGEESCFPVNDIFGDGDDRTWKVVLTDIKDHLKKLEKFECLVESDDGPIYDKDWNDIQISTCRHTPVNSAKLLEYYVLGKCPWPMVGEDPKISGWKHKFVGSHSQFMQITEEELANLMSNEWETDLSDEEFSDDYNSEDDEDAYLAYSESGHADELVWETGMLEDENVS
jgi:hypothetical protein